MFNRKRDTVLVKTYKKPKHYEKDAKKLAKDGWVPAQTSTSNTYRGLAWWTRMPWQKSKDLVVTYQRPA